MQVMGRFQTIHVDHVDDRTEDGATWYPETRGMAMGSFSVYSSKASRNLLVGLAIWRYNIANQTKIADIT